MFSFVNWRFLVLVCFDCLFLIFCVSTAGCCTSLGQQMDRPGVWVPWYQPGAWSMGLTMEPGSLGWAWCLSLWWRSWDLGLQWAGLDPAYTGAYQVCQTTQMGLMFGFMVAGVGTRLGWVPGSCLGPWKQAWSAWIRRCLLKLRAWVCGYLEGAT